MTQQTSPFVETKYGWDFGESGWNSGMDENLLKFSFLFDGTVDGIVSSLPSAVSGQAYFLNTDNRLYFSVRNTWYSSPTPKWHVLTIKSSGATYQFNGTSISEVATNSGLQNRVDALEVTLSTLGTAAFEDTSYFASSSQLDVANSQNQSYTDSSLATSNANLANYTDPTSGLYKIGRSRLIVNTYAELASVVGRYDGDLAETKTYRGLTVLPYADYDQGAAKFRWYPASTATANSGSVQKPTSIGAGSPGRWIMVVEKDQVSVKQFGAYGDGVNDDTDALNACVAANPATNDLTYAQNPTHGWGIYVPMGVYLVGAGTTSRWLIPKNNIRIKGAGEGNSIVKANPSVQIEEVVRFREAYRCELSDITIDGGMPFTPSGSETYGANVGVVFDQVAYFTSKNLTSQYCRYSSFNAIHLWESYFSNLSALGSGWFATVGRIGGAFLFTNLNKESTFFPGFESNQITIDKFSSNSMGTHIHFGVPVFNFKLSQGVFEGRSASRDLQALKQPLFYVTGISNTINVGGYVYAHDQPFAHNSVVIDNANGGLGVSFDLLVYNELSNPSLFLQCPRLVTTTAAYPTIINIDVEDVGGSMTSLLNSGAASPIEGKIIYRTDLLSKTLPPLLTGGAEQRYSGKIGFRAGDFTQERINWTAYDARSKKLWSPVSGGVLYPVSYTVATVAFEGSASLGIVSGSASGLRATTPLTRQAAGDYAVYLLNGVLPSMILTGTAVGGVVRILGKTATYIQFEVVNAAGTKIDSTEINIAVTLAG